MNKKRKKIKRNWWIRNCSNTENIWRR